MRCQRHASAAPYPRWNPVPIVQKAGWASGPVWTGAENLASTGIRSPDRPALRQLVSVLNVKKMDGMKNKMLSQIRALSSNKAWSLRYLFSHARCFCLSFQRWYVLKPSWIRQIAFSLSVVGRCKIPNIKPGQGVKPDGRDFVVVWRKRFRLGQAFRSVSQPRWDFTRLLPTLPDAYCAPNATVVHIVHLQTPRLLYVNCEICQFYSVPL